MRLADFLRRRRQLVEARKADKVRRHNAGQREILRDIESMIALLVGGSTSWAARSPTSSRRARASPNGPGCSLRSPASGPPCSPPCSARCPSSARSADDGLPPWPGSRRMPARAGPGGAPGASGAAAEGPRGPLHRRPDRHPAHPGPRRAPPAHQGTEDDPHRGRAATPRHPQRDDPHRPADHAVTANHPAKKPGEQCLGSGGGERPATRSKRVLRCQPRTQLPPGKEAEVNSPVDPASPGDGAPS